MIVRFSLVLLLVFVCSAASRAQPAWTEYRTQDGGYRVEFPGSPQVSDVILQTSARYPSESRCFLARTMRSFLP